MFYLLEATTPIYPLWRLWLMKEYKNNDFSSGLLWGEAQA